MKSLEELAAKRMPVADVRALFPNATWLDTFDLMRGDVTAHFIEGDLSLDHLRTPEGPWALIVHGDLHATGDLDFWTTNYRTSLLVVLGSMQARNVRFMSGANCVVAQELAVRDYVFGRYGDESAHLEVGGMLRARAILLDHVTGIDAKEIDAICCCSQGWRLPIDISYTGDHENIFAHEILAEGRIDLELAWNAAIQEKDVLLRHAEARFRASRPHVWWNPDA